MILNLINEPFEHLIIPDFLSLEDSTELFKCLSTKVDEDEFFLLVKQDANKNLLKSDKLTRPASIYNVHKALLAYAKLANLKILSSNVVPLTIESSITTRVSL